MHVTKILSVLFLLLLGSLSACSKDESSSSAGAKSAPAEVSAGEEIYKKNCKVCHAQSINGAPIPGNKSMWEPRAQKGIDVLVQHASQGFGLMPPKGGNVDLTEPELRQAIEYMIAQMQ